jgi:phosphatidylethanolamine/phosphatidyl-N-methylethanolamine N-methyltransferase
MPRDVHRTTISERMRPTMEVMDIMTIKRAYERLSPVYDLLFDRIFHPGRVEAIKQLNLRPNDHLLDVGVGTGLNLPLYPAGTRITGIDVSEPMLERAEEKVHELGLRASVELHVMDAQHLTFPDDSFDHVIAAYTISVVPDPVRTLCEMKRVCRPGGHIVILNHFQSENKLIGLVEEWMAPVCVKLGWKTDLKLKPLLERAHLQSDLIHRVNLLNGWRLVRCINHKGSA